MESPLALPYTCIHIDVYANESLKIGTTIHNILLIETNSAHSSSPTGDSHSKHSTDLHSLWDDGVGLFPDIPKLPLSPDSHKIVEDTIDHVLQLAGDI